MSEARQSPRGAVGKSPLPSQPLLDFITIACIVVALFALGNVQLPDDYFQVYRTVGILP